MQRASSAGEQPAGAAADVDDQLVRSSRAARRACSLTAEPAAIARLKIAASAGMLAEPLEVAAAEHLRRRGRARVRNARSEPPHTV